MARQLFKIEGLKELDEALSELPKATARNVLKRALIDAGQPMADEAERLAPRDKGFLQGHIVVSSRLNNKAGKKEFAETMRVTGGDRTAAVQAMRDARRAAGEGESSAEVYIGPVAKAFYGFFQERGTARNKPHPFMRPAFDNKAMEVFGRIKDSLAAELEKARARMARKAARIAAKLGK